MEQNITKQPNKDDFINFVNNILHDKGFEKDPEKELWTKNTQIQSGDRTVIINGQRQDIPGEIHRIKFMVEIYGGGEMNDVNTQEKSSFVQVDFNAEENGVIRELGPTFCIFFDDQFLFESIANKIFGI